LDIQFQGLQPVLSFWIVFIIALISIGAAWWSYDRVPATLSLYKYLLIALRSTVFFILLMLLLNPSFRGETVETVKSKFIYLLDNSASTAVEKGDYNGIADYQSLLGDLNLADTTDISKKTYLFDSDVRSSVHDSLNFTGSETNLHQTLQLIEEQDEDIRGAVLVTDGIFTKGRDPAYMASSLNVPIFTIGIGDTARVKDLIVENVVTNSTGYTNTLHPVQVTVLNNGFSGEQLNISLISDGEKLSGKTVETRGESSSHTVNFEIPLENEGLQQFSIQLEPLPGEWTDKNNIQNFAVDVLDNKTKTLDIAFEIHPDVKAVRNLLATDKNYKMNRITWTGSDRFYGGIIPSSADSVDLLILHGYPQPGIPTRTKQKVNSLAEDVPVLFFNTPSTTMDRADSDISNVLPIEISQRQDFFRVSLVKNKQSQEHPVMELPDINFSKLPLVHAPLRNVSVKPSASTLFTASYRGNNSESPLVIVNEIGNRRSGLINFNGFYGWLQSTDQEVREFATAMLLNVISWVGTPADNQRLEIIMGEKVFQEGQPAKINAYLTNESGQKENDAVIDIQLESEQMDEQFYTMENTGNGQYSLSIPNLPAGLYHFTATAEKGDRTIDTKTGEFSVSNTNNELVNTIRNDALLQQIAGSTGGTFLTYQKADSLNTIFENKNLLEKEYRSNEILYYPYQQPIWFIILIGLLTIEWIIRKYLALP